MARFKRPPALLRSSGAWTSETRSASTRVDAGLLVASGPSVAVGLEALLVGVPLPVRVGISQQVHYPAKLLGGELDGKLCRDPIPVGGESPAGFAGSAVLLGLGDCELVPTLLRVQALPGGGLAHAPAMVGVGLVGVDYPVASLLSLIHI